MKNLFVSLTLFCLSILCGLVNTHSALASESYLINLPTTHTTHHLFRIAHRFNGQVEQETEESSAGMDHGAMIRLGFDYVLGEYSQIGLSRTSWTGNMEAQFKHRFFERSLWSMALAAGTNQETGLKEKQDGTGNSYNAQWLIQRDSGQLLWLASVLYASQTDPESSGSSTAVATGGWYYLNPLHKVSVELIKPTIGYIGDNDYPLTSIAWHWQSGAHIFQLVLSNSIQLNSNRFIATDGIQDARQLHLGFSVNRYF